MKILFWFNGSGGQRRERLVKDYPYTLENLQLNSDIIEEDLDEWRHSLRSSGEYQRWGWDENFDPVTLEPLSPRA
jgi:hypothetical protein